jgi:hypothetical protein
MNGPHLHIVPCPLYRANEYVQTLHRHHKPTSGGLYAVACADDSGDVHGVGIIGRPVARLLDDGQTCEVLRVATDGTRNACSAIYGAAFRAAKALGYSRIFTYTRVDEPGVSLRASGWVLDDPAIRARSWDMPNRRRSDKTEIVQRQRWVKEFGEAPRAKWPHGAVDDSLALFEVPS